MKKISYGKQSISKADIDAVVDVLNSDYLTQGPVVSQFEKQISDYTGAKYCVAVSSGTAALHLAVKALGIPKKMEGITSPNTFVATANSMIYSGLIPRFSDIDDSHYCMDTDRLDAAISPNTRLLMPVHFAGYPCDMEGIHRLSKTHGLHVIEDAAHAIGSKYADGSRVGNCRYSDMTVFSFHPVKTITTGEGGAITTNDEQLYEKLKSLASHGIVRDVGASETAAPVTRGPLYYEMRELGYNYRISDLQCALGISQLSRIDRFIKRRRAIAERYNEAFNAIDRLIMPAREQGVYSSWHLYVVQLQGIDRTDVYYGLKEKGIHTNVHYIPVHLHPYYQEHFGYGKGDFPISEAYYEHALTLPLSPAMTDEEVDYTIHEFKQVLTENK